MRYRWVKTLILVGLCIGHFAFAEEEAAPASSGKVSVEFQKKRAKLNSINNKIESARKELSNLVATNSETYDVEEKKALNARMLEVHDELVKLSDEKEALEKELRYEWPGDGKEDDRQYFAVKPEGEQQEQEQKEGLQSLLTRVRKTIELHYNRQFGDKDKEDPLFSAEAAKQKRESEASKNSETLRLEK